MNRSSRMFEIIQLLRSARRSMTAADLADELEVTKRTIYRDILALQSMRVPIDGEAGIGYIMRPGFDLPPLMFTAEEAEAIAVGMSLLGRTGDAGLEKAARNVVRKISDVMHSDDQNRNESAALSESVFASGRHEIPASGIDTRILRQAVRAEEKLQIEYTDLQLRNTTRVILPLAVIYYVDAVILAAWCELRDDFRHFRIDRIKACLPNKTFFTENGNNLREQWRSQHQLDTTTGDSRTT